LTAVNPEVRKIIRDILLVNAPSITNETPGPLVDYKAAEHAVKTRGLSEATVNEFAEEKKLAEVMLSIAQLSRLSVYEIEQLFSGRWTIRLPSF
jgi:hypothetical protein